MLPPEFWPSFNINYQLISWRVYSAPVFFYWPIITCIRGAEAWRDWIRSSRSHSREVPAPGLDQNHLLRVPHAILHSPGPRRQASIFAHTVSCSPALSSTHQKPSPEVGRLWLCQWDTHTVEHTVEQNSGTKPWLSGSSPHSQFSSYVTLNKEFVSSFFNFIQLCWCIINK